MRAFHNDQTIKDKYIARVKSHQDMDEIIQGKYWQNGRGCAVGCTIHGEDHNAYEQELGIPMALARLEDGIFVRLPLTIAKEFPLKFLEAIETGSDLSLVIPKFIHWLLVDKDHGAVRHANTNKTIEAIEKVAELYQQKIDGKIVSVKEWRAARAYAYAQAAAAYAQAADADVADYAAYAQAAAAEATAAADATLVADYAAQAVAAAAVAVAEAAAAVAEAAARVDVAKAAYRVDAYRAVAETQANKLIELLKDAN